MAPVTVHVKLAAHAYPIHILQDGMAEALADHISGRQVAIIADAQVAGLPHGKKLIEQLRARASASLLCMVPAGESSKCAAEHSRLCSELAAANMNRSCRVIALGGGVIGDLAGYVAATYLRGVAFIQVPTTLLAMVDSSVGGKTGINLPEGKNLVGAFHQPEVVFIDPSWLDTLPPREFAAGMAEVIKYGVIRDPELISACEKGTPQHLPEIIRRCVQIKADVVSDDEKETTGLRAILNFGHTLGHAIEQTSGYGKLLHGEAVSLGMVAACWISEKTCGLDPAFTCRLEATLTANSLPIRQNGLDYTALLAAIGRDKKAGPSGVKWVLCPELGGTQQSSDIDESVIRDVVHRLGQA